MQRPENCIIVIFGASGDLTKRKLMPALFELYEKELLPEKFGVIGLGRTPFSDDSFREKMQKDVQTYQTNALKSSEKLNQFLKHAYYHPLDSRNPEDYEHLKIRLDHLHVELGTHGNTIFYLSTSPGLFGDIVNNLGKQGLNQQNNAGNWKRIVVEKPFGFDLDSARKLNYQFQKAFKEQQIYRIDHYLGKETVQNILAFRFANGIFEPLWNRNFIHHVEITGAEHIGVEDRGGYYDSSGALRDMVQNHLLQIAATIAMEPPSRFEANAVRNEKVKLFQSLCPIKAEDVNKRVVRGQYLHSMVRGKNVPGYREEKNVPPDSRTETFVAMKFGIDNWRWGGVPFYLRSGKRMPTRVTEVAIHFKKTPHKLFKSGSQFDNHENLLIIRIQPDEGILLKFGMKLPGAGFNIKTVEMDFHYSDLSENYVPDAYVRLLLDAMLGDATLYARADAVETCWEFITPILDVWQNDPANKLYGYPAGTWGPKEADGLFIHSGEGWRAPCKNLAKDGEYCEL